MCVCVWGCGPALFQARVTRAHSALWGWGPVAMDTDKSADRRNMQSRVKSRRGGPGVTGVRSSCDGQEVVKLLIYF